MEKKKRRLLGMFVSAIVVGALQYAGAGWVSLIVIPYGLFEWWEGQETERDLRRL